MHFLLKINKRPLRHYGSTSIRLRLLRDTLVDSRGLGWVGLGRTGKSRAAELSSLYEAEILS